MFRLSYWQVTAGPCQAIRAACSLHSWTGYTNRTRPSAHFPTNDNKSIYTNIYMQLFRQTIRFGTLQEFLCILIRCDPYLIFVNITLVQFLFTLAFTVICFRNIWLIYHVSRLVTYLADFSVLLQSMNTWCNTSYRTIHMFAKRHKDFSWFIDPTRVMWIISSVISPRHFNFNFIALLALHRLFSIPSTENVLSGCTETSTERQAADTTLELVT
jgi:hypothetical protein